jgi:hypothetical protein
MAQEIKDQTGKVITLYLTPMESKCVQCKKSILPEDGVFMVLASPYHACLHRWCAPFFSFDGVWPHSMPFVFYTHTGNPETKPK